MTHRIGPKGQVVIPKEIRDALGLRPGSVVDFEHVEDAVIVRRHPLASELVGRYRTPGASLTADLVEERARDRRAEERHVG